ncbi:penicillin-binding protein 2 [Bacteroidales bacterium]
MAIENYKYNTQRQVITLIILAIAGVFVVRLFYLQVINQSYKLSSQNNVLRFVTQYPARGTIFDRNGELLVYNEAAYDLLVIPRQAKIEDTLAFCRLLKIDLDDFRNRLRSARKFSLYRPTVFLEQISKEDYGFIIEKLYHYPGFFFQARTLRKYPRPIAAHVMGDVGEVNGAEMERDPVYKMGDYIGKSGLEKFYEKALRGRKGMKIMMVDVHNREKGSFQNGAFDTVPVTGKNIYLGIDARLQEYGEKLMVNKTGSIVAIDPATGEILALVSSPNYDPNLLVGRARGKNFNELLQNEKKPLINRAIGGTYPPGSTFKMFNALVALQTGSITEDTRFTCQGKNSSPIRCTHSHVTPLSVHAAIENSCNPFFWNTFRSILGNSSLHGQKKAFDVWYQKMLDFGLGQRFKTDIPFEVAGNIPSGNYFDKVYNGRWNAMTVRSLSIGQGEILLTPLQLANLAALVGNEGYYYPPHLARKLGEEGDTLPAHFTQKRETGIESRYFRLVKSAMLDVFEGGSGTARRYKVKEFQAAGKTGTAENPHGKDHSLFMAFAPYDKPTIAIAVVVENAGFGATWAAPIASLMMELYITGEVKRPELEKFLLETTPSP